jgi:hypothetical protein
MPVKSPNNRRAAPETANKRAVDVLGESNAGKAYDSRFAVSETFGRRLG